MGRLAVGVPDVVLLPTLGVEAFSFVLVKFKFKSRAFRLSESRLSSGVMDDLVERKFMSLYKSKRSPLLILRLDRSRSF